jgi:RimJ/RimL family protein N-acetyltransferase
MSKNVPSKNLFRKLGFELQTVLTSRAAFNGEYIDLHLYQLIKERFEKIHKTNNASSLLEISIDH